VAEICTVDELRIEMRERVEGLFPVLRRRLSKEDVRLEQLLGKLSIRRRFGRGRGREGYPSDRRTA